MISFIKSISKWESPKIKSIGLCPGLISNTKMYKTFDNERLKKLKKQNPNKEFVNSNDLAKIIIDVIKPHWKHANGSIIDVNGGVF
jgi:NAD(P)-dependent dehydrogenase (short-subunit alcohol dehydrogenase family)